MGLKKYVICGLGEFFDGLVVHCDEDSLAAGCATIDRIEQPSQLFETFSIPVSNGLVVYRHVLKEYVEPADDLLADNPFGMYKSEGKIEREGVVISWGLDSRALTLNIKNKNRTLLSKNVFDKEDIHNVRAYLDTSSVDDNWDICLALFDIQEICDGS